MFTLGHYPWVLIACFMFTVQYYSILIIFMSHLISYIFLMNFRLSSMSFAAYRNDLCHIYLMQRSVLKLVMFYIHCSPNWQRLAQDPSCSRQHQT
jgi:hypothetical protein